MSERLILITNDDGIHSKGLERLAGIASAFGRVWVVAPDGQRSAASHSITFHHPLDVFPCDYPVRGVRAFTCSGTPADCARIGILHLLPEKPDVLLSGINFGYNMASDIQYSGTVGAALEAAFLGVHAIAVSYGNFSFNATDIVDRYLPGLLEEYMEKPLPANQIWNINFPDCAAEECMGIMRNAVMNTEHFYDDRYLKEKVDGKTWSVTNIALRKWNGPEHSDLYAVCRKYIAVGTVTNLT